jgi:PfaB family protein
MEKIAIVGMSCLFPGADNLAQFWQNLLEEKCSVSLANEAQMGVNPDIFYDAQKGKTGKHYCRQGGYIKNFQFDPTGYRIAPDVLESLDEIYHWSLYVAKQALLDSGYLDNAQKLANCGVILGNLSLTTRLSHRLIDPIYYQTVDSVVQELLQQTNFQLKHLPSTRSPSVLNLLTSGYPSAVIAQALSLSRINFSLDAACSSSLYAVKLACEYLLAGKAEMMLAGAVSGTDPLSAHTAFSIFQAYPDDETTRPFDKNSGGLVTGEGAGMLVLKRYSDAVRNGDRIYALVRGVGLSNDGRGKHLLSPNPKGQIIAFERAYAEANVDPTKIDYVECHGTGTPLGDRTELESMEAFFGRYHASPAIGSVKSNLGHLLTAAGMPSIIKVILSMSEGLIPPTLNVREPLASIDRTIGGDKVVRSLCSWTSQDSSKSKYGAVSAFGFGGNNAHLILEGAGERESRGAGEQRVEGNLVPITDRQSPSQEKMAIVGMDAFFGSCDGLEAFEKCIYTGEQLFASVPNERWKGIEDCQLVLERYGFKDGAPSGAYVEGFEMDYLHFKIPPSDTDRPMPQQLLMLKVADRALQDAQIKTGQNVAVLIAMNTDLSSHWWRSRCDLSWQVKESLAQAGLTLPPEKLAELEELLQDSYQESPQVNKTLSTIGNIVASRISAKWDFHAPSFTISAEENSVFKALEVAQLLLCNSDLDAVVVGGVDLSGCVENVLLRQQLTPINTGIATLGYDDRANGWQVGEGAGAVVLKRLDLARQNQERIYAAIDTIAMVQDNSTPDKLENLPQPPKADTVKRSCQEAFKRSRVAPETIGYLEVYGSGIAPEDRAEIAGLLSAYQNEQDELSCALGSIKANIGHTYAASGMASLIKTALCLYHQYLPATPQWTKPKQPELWQHNSFYVPTKSRHWYLPNSITKRVAAINGMGLDRTYSHLVLSEEPGHIARSSNYLADTPLYLFPLAAGSLSTLLEQLDRLDRAIDENDSLTATAARVYAEFQQQTQAPYALVILGRDRVELKREIDRAKSGVATAFERGEPWKTPLGSYFTTQPLGDRGEVAFVYPGGFNSYLGMGDEIYHLFPQIRDRLADFTDHPNVKQLHYRSSLLLYPRSLKRLSRRQLELLETRLLDNSVAMLMSGIVLSLGYTEILQNYLQVQPQFAFGYSLGEVSMMYAQDVWRDAERIANRFNSSSLFELQLSGPKNAVRQHWGLPLTHQNASEDFWGVYALMCPADRVIESLNNFPRAYVTHINAPEEVVIAGDPQSCLSAIEQLGCNYFPAPFDHVIHCEPTRRVINELVEWFTVPVERVPTMTLYCADNYAPMRLESQTIARNIASGLCKPLDFQRLVERVYDDGARIFIEVGAGNTCSRSIAGILKQKEHAAMAIDNRGVDEHVSLFRVLAQLIAHRVSIDLSPLYASSEINLTKRKSLLKTVTLGGCRLDSTILTEENRQKFAPYVSSIEVKTAIDSDRQITKELEKEPVKSLVATGVGSTSSSHSTRAEPSRLEMNPPVDRLLKQQLSEHKSLVTQTHTEFLRSRQIGLQQLGEIIQTQIAASEQLLFGDGNVGGEGESGRGEWPFASPKPIFSEADVIEFATGKIASVFGKEYEIIDSYARRVRLPMPPYMFISRVTKFEGKRGCFEPCAIETEYDIPKDAWYAYKGNLPTAIILEASHGCMFMLSYLGIDFEAKGERVYRVIDASLTFLADKPIAGTTFRCHVQLDSFTRNNGNFLYKYIARYYSGSEIFLEIEGTAGMFSDQQLKQGQGITLSKIEQKLKQQIQKQYFKPLLHCSKSTFELENILHLCAGDIAACFGDRYEQNGKNYLLGLPPQSFLMFDRVLKIEPQGGAWGLGLIVAEKSLDPQQWYFNCHFKDDLCLPGTLMSEGSSQLLAFYSLYLGLQTLTSNATFQPLTEVTMISRHRGQVTPTNSKLTYQLEIGEIGMKPKPFVKAEASIVYGGKIIAITKNLGIQLSEKRV